MSEEKENEWCLQEGEPSLSKEEWAELNPFSKMVLGGKREEFRDIEIHSVPEGQCPSNGVDSIFGKSRNVNREH